MWREALLLFAASPAAAPGAEAIAAQPPPIAPASEVRLRHQIYRGHGLTAYLLRIPPGQGTQMHRHDKDILTIFISGGRTTAVFEGSAPRTDTLASGTVRYRTAGFAHSTRNDGATDFRAVLLEFDKPQGVATPPDGQADLLCTPGFCVRDVSVAARERLAGSGTAFFVPLGSALVRETSGRRHVQRDGSIWRGPYGWTNDGTEAARVIVVDMH